MDLNELIPDDGPITVELKHPQTGDALGMTITVASRYSDTYENYMYEKVQERIDRGDTEERKLTLKEIREQNLDMYAALTLKWDILLDGKKPKVTKAKEVYNRLKWIIPQIEESVLAKEGFTET